MQRLILSFLFLFFAISLGVAAQSHKNKSLSGITQPVAVAEEEIIHVWVEQMPEFPGGLPELFKFILKNLRYPAVARNNKIQGIAYAIFTIEVDGSIHNPSIVKGLSYGCDEEVIRVIKLIPRWIPGEQNGRKVAVKYCLPIRFNLSV